MAVTDRPIPVALAEGSYLIRESLVQMLHVHTGVELVAVCADRDALEEAIECRRPRVVLTDVRMLHSTGPDGIQLADRLRQRHPRVGVLVLADNANAERLEQLFASGSARRGVLLKHQIRHSRELIVAIEAVDRGETVMDPELVSALIGTKAQPAHSPLAQLTARERGLLALLAEGQSNAAIAESLVITKRAVEKHVNSIFHKLGLEASRSAHISRRVTASLIFLAEQKARAPRAAHTASVRV